MSLKNGSDVNMEFKLLDKRGKEVVIVKRLNLHSYSLKGIKGTPFSNLIMCINPSELPEYKNDLIYLHNLNMIEKFVQKHNLIIPY